MEQQQREQLEDKCFDLAQECIKKFEQAHDVKYDKYLQIKFDLKGHTAGKAYYNKHVIRLNGDLLERYQDEFVRETVPHECAHLFTHMIFPNAEPHGYYWKSMMHILGYSPDRTHNYETVAARKTRKFVYSCTCRQHELGGIRHKKASKGWTTYNCRTCREDLTYTGRSIVK